MRLAVAALALLFAVNIDAESDHTDAIRVKENNMHTSASYSTTGAMPKVSSSRHTLSSDESQGTSRREIDI